ncbi:MAG: formate/nitrite transporter family protein [Burkholderiales bacterium]
MALYGFDAFSPAEIAERVERVGVAKARLPLVTLVMLALQRVLGGVVFSLGLLLVVVAGAELFTGNNLIALAWAEGKVMPTLRPTSSCSGENLAALHPGVLPAA